MNDVSKSDGAARVYTPRWMVLLLLMLAYVCSFADRQIFAILLQPIKAAMNLSDTELGLLGGLAFALLYTGFGIPVARLADRYSRTKIISICLAMWSVMTAMCGATTNFLTLAVARVGVGVGEAGCNPPAHSVLSDYFSPRERSTAFGIYALGIPIGGALGSLIGGYANVEFGWRMAFVIVGLPGLLLAPIIGFVIKEPPRGLSENFQALETANSPTLREVALMLWRNRTFHHLCAAFALTAFAGYGVALWYPTYLIRGFGLDTGTVGLVSAVAGVLFGSISCYAGGALVDKYSKRDLRWSCWIPALALLVNIPLTITMLFQDQFSVVVPIIFASSLLTSAHLGPIYALAQTLSPLRMRALTSSILLFVTNLIGLGFGPLAVGIASDIFSKLGVNKSNGFGATNSLRYALLMTSIFALWSALHYVLAARTLREDIACVADVKYCVPTTGPT